MEKLWYNLSPNVLEEMIRFAPKSEYEECPNFILEIEAVASAMSRYLMNLIDSTKQSIFCLTSAEYTKTFPINDATVGKMIRILRYWLFQIETDLDRNNLFQRQYIIMISNAEILRLAPVKSIGSLTCVVPRTIRMRGIVDTCFGATYTANGRKFLRFCLRDNTGCIGCTAWGTLCSLLESHLKKGVKLEVYHAVASIAEPTYRICDNKLELNLNQFSVLNIYDPKNLSLIYAHPSRNVIEEKSMESISIKNSQVVVDTLSNESSTIPDKVTEFQKCSNGMISIPIISLKTIGVCTSWIRGEVEHYRGLATTRVNTVFTRFRVRDHTSAIVCTVWEPVCTPVNAVLKNGMIVEIFHANVRMVLHLSKISDKQYEIFLNKFSTIKVFTIGGSVVYEYEYIPVINPQPQKLTHNVPTDLLKEKSIDGKLPVTISSLTKEGFLLSWIRGIMEHHAGLDRTRTNEGYTRFYLRDNTGTIHCTVWEPICMQLNPVLKEGMVLEIFNCKIRRVRNRYKLCKHENEIFLDKCSSIRVFTAQDKLVFEFLARR